MRLLIKEATWAKLPRSIYYAAQLCREDVTYGLPEAMSGYIFMPLAVASCIHFVVLGREVGQKCAAKTFDDLEGSGRRHLRLLSLWRAVEVNARLLPLWLGPFPWLDRAPNGQARCHVWLQRPALTCHRLHGRQRARGALATGPCCAHMKGTKHFPGSTVASEDAYVAREAVVFPP